MTLIDLGESEIDDIIDTLKYELSNFESAKNHPKYDLFDKSNIEYERTFIRYGRIVNKLETHLHPKSIINWDRRR